MRRTKIVATIGPASQNLETLTRMAAAHVFGKLLHAALSLVTAM